MMSCCIQLSHQLTVQDTHCARRGKGGNVEQSENDTGLKRRIMLACGVKWYEVTINSLNLNHATGDFSREIKQLFPM